MIKNSFLIILLTLFAFTAIGCTQSTTSKSTDFSSAQATLSTLQNALKDHNYELAYSCYSEEFKLQTGNTLERFSNSLENNPEEVNQIINAKIIEELNEGEDIIISTDDGEGYKFSEINNQWKIVNVK